MKKGYVVAVWCPDCVGEDFDGCFGGGVEYLVKCVGDGFITDGRSEAHIFLSVSDAEAAAKQFVGDSIWDYRVEEAWFDWNVRGV